jgi:dTDP-4-dehydrorhamnose reductase
MRVLITGASGQLGAYLLAALRAGGDHVIAWSGSRTGTLEGIPLHPVDLANPAAVSAAFAEARPDAVLHAAAWARISDCEQDPAVARQVNVEGTALLARLAAAGGARLVFVSTDLVFDGEKAPYREEDTPRPVSEYGRSKTAAEEVVREVAHSVVARVSLLFGPSRMGRLAFFDDQVAALRQGRPLTLFRDEWRTPLDLATAARGLLELLRSDFCGTLHLAGPERMSRLEMGQRLAAHLGVDGSGIGARLRADLPGSELRPRDVSLDTTWWRQHFPNLPRPGWTESLTQMGVARGERL